MFPFEITSVKNGLKVGFIKDDNLLVDAVWKVQWRTVNFISHPALFCQTVSAEVDRVAILHEKRQHNNRAQRKRERDGEREENVDNYSRAKLSLWNLLCMYEVSLPICPAFSVWGPAPVLPSAERTSHTYTNTETHMSLKKNYALFRFMHPGYWFSHHQL